MSANPRENGTVTDLGPDSGAEYFRSITLAARLHLGDKLRAGFAGQPKTAIPTWFLMVLDDSCSEYELHS
jgi:hypothetical protein